MNDERVQILRMVQEGKVSPEEAAKLLDALEQPEAKAGARQKPRNVRFLVVDGNSKATMTLSIGVAKWLLQLPFGMGLVFKGPEGVTSDVLLDALDTGTIGKVFEAEQGKQRIEVWLDA
jgi:hypothetical protein